MSNRERIQLMKEGRLHEYYDRQLELEKQGTPVIKRKINSLTTKKHILVTKKNDLLDQVTKLSREIQLIDKELRSLQRSV